MRYCESFLQLKSKMKKLLETSFGGGGVDTSQPIKTAYDKLFAIYDNFQKLMETSAYMRMDKDGRKTRTVFPMSNKVSTVEKMTEQFKQQYRLYKTLQERSMDENPNYKAKYFAKEFDHFSADFAPVWNHKQIREYGEKHCWPRSKMDNTVKSFADKISEFGTLVHIRDNFEAQIQKYC